MELRPEERMLFRPFFAAWKNRGKVQLLQKNFLSFSIALFSILET